jgi:hypothetical protein
LASQIQSAVESVLGSGVAPLESPPPPMLMVCS